MKRKMKILSSNPKKQSERKNSRKKKLIYVIDYEAKEKSIQKRKINEKNKGHAYTVQILDNFGEKMK